MEIQSESRAGRNWLGFPKQTTPHLFPLLSLSLPLSLPLLCGLEERKYCSFIPGDAVPITALMTPFCSFGPKNIHFGPISAKKSRRAYTVLRVPLCRASICSPVGSFWGGCGKVLRGERERDTPVNRQFWENLKELWERPEWEQEAPTIVSFARFLRLSMRKRCLYGWRRGLIYGGMPGILLSPRRLPPFTKFEGRVRVVPFVQLSPCRKRRLSCSSPLRSRLQPPSIIASSRA